MGTNTAVFHQAFLQVSIYTWRYHSGGAQVQVHSCSNLTKCSTVNLIWRFPKEQISVDSAAAWLLLPDSEHLTPRCNADNTNSWQKRESKYTRTKLWHWHDAW